MFNLDLLFQKSDLIPVIVQHAENKDVLMLGFTNREAVELTLKTGTAWFWSRSRQEPTPCSISACPTGPPATPGPTVAFSTRSRYNKTGVSVPKKGQTDPGLE